MRVSVGVLDASATTTDYDDLISQTLIERWDGTSWTIVNSPNTNTQSNVLLGVTCGSASDCWAVGDYAFTGSVLQTLIERWNGTSWEIVSSPNTSATQSNLLYGVTCGPASDCWAVGYYIVDAVSNLNQTLIERWDGTSWTVVSSPNTSATQSNLLYGVTCGSTPDCWAVGYYYNASSVAQTLAFEVHCERDSHSNANRDAGFDRFTKAYSDTKASPHTGTSFDTGSLS